MSSLLENIDQLSTDSDDEEYIPEGYDRGSPHSDADASYSDVEEEDIMHMNEEGGISQKTKARFKRKKTVPRKRKRKRASEGVEAPKEEEEDVIKKEEKEKARIDDLWASFKQGASHKPQDSKGKAADEATPPKKLKIQKAYDFAGEEILVEKEVAADSKEAIKYLHTSAKTPTELKTSSSPSSSLSSQPPVTMQDKTTAVKKRGSGLSSILQSLDKKKKMTTLEKTNMDWAKYKREEGLEEELTKNSKDGYLAKQDFLQWSDHKQFEREKEERLKRIRRL